jgi:hypothetical protein
MNVTEQNHHKNGAECSHFEIKKNKIFYIYMYYKLTNQLINYSNQIWQMPRQKSERLKGA